MEEGELAEDGLDADEERKDCAIEVVARTLYHHYRHRCRVFLHNETRVDIGDIGRVGEEAGVQTEDSNLKRCSVAYVKSGEADGYMKTKDLVDEETLQ
uniref:Uncharacterized protein n=1 Tax=Zea mays TaxID=4577 RepID=A0A804UIE7_MAIZE